MQSAEQLAWQLFQSPHYQRHNQRRQEHLASLRLPRVNRTVLELGAGVGDHRTFFLDRGCSVTSIEARRENVNVMVARFRAMEPYAALSRLTVLTDDLNQPKSKVAPVEVIYNYG